MSRLKILLLAASLSGVSSVRAQFTDDFSDGEFHSSPDWNGDAAKFTVNSGSLRLLAPAVTGTAFLSTPSLAIHEASWEFSMRMDFTPSSTNYARIYLVSDQANLQTPLNGYFVKVGNTSREVSLYRQTGSTETEILDGRDDRVNLPVVVLRIRVTRDALGQWSMWSETGGTGLELEGSTVDTTHGLSGWFGIQCVYTSTRSDKFWFDDFIVTGAIVPDTTPPQLVRTEAPDPFHVFLFFSEPVLLVTVGAVVLENVGALPLTMTADGMSAQGLVPSPLANGVTYVLRVAGLADAAGNMVSTETSVRYFNPAQPATKCILVTEIFPDPSPQVGLPTVEFIELYNPGEEPFSLKDWKLTDGSSTGKFAEYILLPRSFVIVTTTSGVSLFGNANSVGVENFPSLNNAGDNLMLMDNLGQPIDSVEYASSWYRDEDKAEGGWSLELIDPGNPCGAADNWTASENEQGGTPGETNSVNANKPDLSPPTVVSIRATDSLTVSVRFNELLAATAADVIVTVTPDLLIEKICMDHARNSITVFFAQILQPRQSYTMFLEDVRDCNGNRMERTGLSFGRPEPGDSLDVVLSEILFNPRSGGVDFIEIYNRSEKFIDLEHWSVNNGEDEIFLPAFQLHPRSWLALTPDPDLLMTQHPNAAETQLVRSDLPSLPDHEGRIQLANERKRCMDSVAYNEDWHSVFLKSVEGVSLERIDFANSAQQASNWMSASAASGFATPGLPNSQQRGTETNSSTLTVVPEIFSPGSSFADFVQIQYRFDQPGSVVSMTVYDQQGRPVKRLADNVTLSNEGFLRWEGDREDGSPAPAGYYVLRADRFDHSGQTEMFLRRIVIAAK